jgi:hypothetical protein
MTKRRFVMKPVATMTHSGAPATTIGSVASCADAAYTETDIASAQPTGNPPFTRATPQISAQAAVPGSDCRIAR